MKNYKIQKLESEMNLLERAGDMIDDPHSKEEVNQRVMALENKIYQLSK